MKQPVLHLVTLPVLLMHAHPLICEAYLEVPDGSTLLCLIVTGLTAPGTAAQSSATLAAPNTPISAVLHSPFLTPHSGKAPVFSPEGKSVYLWSSTLHKARDAFPVARFDLEGNPPPPPPVAGLVAAVMRLPKAFAHSDIDSYSTWPINLW